MLDWFAVCNVPVIVVALNDPADTPLVTVSDPSVPIVVMLDWIAVANVPVILVAVIDDNPVIVPAFNLIEVPDPNTTSPTGNNCKSPVAEINISA